MGNLIGGGSKIDFGPDEKFTYEQLIDGIKNKKFKNIVFLSGAGISVSAGIPDFRTPGTGLYSKVQELDLPYPEALFSIDYFRQEPEKFYTFASAFVETLDAKPVLAHYFVSMVNKFGQLRKSFTQNVDGLELDAGVPSGKLVEAHGHLREAKCIKCSKSKDPEELKKYLKEIKVMKCSCGGLVKPTVTFFGESLPLSFYTSTINIKMCDLAIVMGTSLTVYPFASLIDMVPNKTPMVLINRDNCVTSRNRFLFMGGDIEKNMAMIIKDLGWENELSEEMKIKVNELNKGTASKDANIGDEKDVKEM